MSGDQTPDRQIHVDPSDQGGGDDDLVDEKGPAQADAEDPTMGGTSDADTSA